MENVAAIVQSIATLAWPLIVIILLFSFRSSIRGLIETAKSRKFTVKVAGNELTMEEISEQQRSLITDLQKQLSELQEKVDGLTKVQPSMSEAEKPKLAEERAEAARRILWVDDKPKNNSLLIQGIQDKGIQVVTALSTREALEKFRSAKFDRVITDMGRNEEGQFNPIAGLELTKTIRDTDTNTPIFVYTSSRGMQDQKAAYNVGVTGITSSPSALLSMLQLETSHIENA